MKAHRMGRAWAGAVALAVGGTWVGLPGAASGQEGRREVEAGNRLYDEGRYPEAHARYLEAIEKAPGLPLARFNEGNALYRSQEFQRAMEAYVRALEDGEAQEGGGAGGPDWAGRAWYNLGNALLRQQQLGSAVEAYKEALRRDPSDADAKHNLEVALAQLEQQQQQQQGDGQDGDGQDGDDEQESQQDSQQDGQSDPAGGDRQDQDTQQGDDPQQSGEEPRQGDDPQSNADGADDPQGQPQQAPGQMTPEQAERLLQAIGEDPSEVNRKAVQARGRRPRKDW